MPPQSSSAVYGPAFNTQELLVQYYVELFILSKRTCNIFMQQNQRNSLVAESVAKAVIENRAMSCFVPCCCSGPRSVANVPESCRCPMCVANVPAYVMRQKLLMKLSENLLEDY